MKVILDASRLDRADLLVLAHLMGPFRPWEPTLAAEEPEVAGCLKLALVAELRLREALEEDGPIPGRPPLVVELPVGPEQSNHAFEEVCLRVVPWVAVRAEALSGDPELQGVCGFLAQVAAAFEAEEARRRSQEDAVRRLLRPGGDVV